MNKYIVVVIFSVLCVLGWAESFPVSVDMVRYLDKNANTCFEINYQVKYKNLSFIKQANGYFADLHVKLEILRGEEVLKTQEFTNKIGVRNEADSYSEQKSFLDKIALTLAKSDYIMRLTFSDPALKVEKIWSKPLEVLPRNQIISEVEFSKAIVADTTKTLEKFHRSGKLFYCEPSHVFYKTRSDSLNLYMESYQLASVKEANTVTTVAFVISNAEGKEWEGKEKFTSGEAINPHIVRLPFGQLPIGVHDLKIVAERGNQKVEENCHFVVAEEKEELISIFPNVDDEYTLLQYFVLDAKLAGWPTVSLEGKKRMANQLWLSLAAEHNMDINQWINLVHERINYCNRNFSHFKSGWQTDMGRIYIRYGNPDEIQKKQTSDDTKFVRKDYQIWKYQNSMDRMYAFIDIQMNGNYKLIYVKNDDQEHSQANWQRYLGSNVDEDNLGDDSSYPER